MTIKLIELPITMDYVANWGLWEAFRELLQNWLDSKKAGTFTSTRLTQQDTVLPLKSLLLGFSSKRDDISAIGGYGEGYKLALLVLTRLQKYPVIRNGKDLWEFEAKFSTNFQIETLHITINEDYFNDDSNELYIQYDELSPDEIAEITEKCLQLQSPGIRHSGYYGDILVGEEYAGKLYVNGLYVNETTLNYGYNIKPEFLKLERDRRTVDNFDLVWTTGKMWLDTREYDTVAEMIESDIPDVAHIGSSSDVELREACYRLFRKNSPEAIPVATEEHIKEAAFCAPTRIVTNAFRQLIISSPQWENSLIPITQEVPRLVLQEWFKKAKKHMRTKAIVSFKTLIKKAENWEKI